MNDYMTVGGGDDEGEEALDSDAEDGDQEQEVDVTQPPSIVGASRQGGAGWWR